MWSRHKGLAVSLAAVAIAAIMAGCGGQEGVNKQAVSVNTYCVTAEDTVVPAEYSGIVSATDKVPVMPKISGRILEKYVQGGQTVAEGQPLFRLDSRSYQAALNAAMKRRLRQILPISSSTCAVTGHWPMKMPLPCRP